jgi:hypothetical protein
MELLRCKARLSVLWLTMAIGTVSSLLLVFMKPGGIEGIMGGEMGRLPLSEGTLLLYAIFFLIPMVVAILCLTIDGAANRWLSFVLGIIWGLWMVSLIFSHITMGEAVPIASWLMMGAGLVISAYIAYFAWKLPQVET